MSWKTVAICEMHWREQEGNREPVRMQLPPLELEHCYVEGCGCPLNRSVIYVRREV